MKRLAWAIFMMWAVAGLGAPGRTWMEAPAPGDTRDRRPQFRWSAANQATLYLLSITRNGTPYLEKWTRKTNWAPRFDFPEGVFEARVIAYDGAEYGQWAPRVRFRRVFTPSVSGLNGIMVDGAVVNLSAGPGIVIDTVKSNCSIVISSTGITSTQLVAYSITSEKIDSAAVTHDKVADNAIFGDKIADGGITSNKIAAGAIVTDSLAAGAVTSGKIATGAIGTDALAAGAVTSAKIATGAIGTDALADGSVTSPKIATGSVTSNKIASGNVLLTHLASGDAVAGQALRYSGVQWEPGGLYNGYAEGPITIVPRALVAGAIAIGENGVASAFNSAALGGWANTVEEDSSCSVIAGGQNNTIASNSKHSVIAGGKLNYISKSYSFAAGYQARATNEGSFVWSDSSGFGVGSWGTNTVMFMANGGVRFQSSTPLVAGHRVQWKPGDASWQFSSDRNLKEGLAPIDGQDVLDRVAELPVFQWQFKGSDRVHIGVMAQDFYAAFPFPGAEETLIDSADQQGVTLGAVQALYQKLKVEQSRNAALEARLDALEKRLEKLGAAD